VTGGVSDLPVAVPLRQADLSGLPAQVRIHEVGPRDGLQAESVIVPVAVKAELVRRLLGAGLAKIELTSFVPPSWIPQLADAEELMASLADLPLTARPGLVTNQRGLDRAVAAGCTEVAVVVSATDTFARRNLNNTVRGAIDLATAVARDALAAGLRVRGYVSMCFGDPWEGPVPVSQVTAAVGALAEAGCYEVSLGDTIGVATPGQVLGMLDALGEAAVTVDRLALHLHDTYGQALANVVAGLMAGVSVFDSSVGGLGGCPYAQSASGNLATEELVWLLEGLGIETGVDLVTVAEVGDWMATEVGRPGGSRVGRALRTRS